MLVQVIVGIIGLALIIGMLWDGFETMIVPRRVSHPIRFARLFFRVSSKLWYSIGERLTDAGRREHFLSLYGPLSLILLLGLWAAGLILGYALLQWALGSQLVTGGQGVGFFGDVYMSATTFFTLGLGDIVPQSRLARAITAIEGGVGFGFLALTIAYLPVLYQSFSSRETLVSTLDEWAGSPPSAGEMLLRLCRDDALPALDTFLRDWEQWSAQLLESNLSYPILGFFRSQHENQSWVSALTFILDLSALVLVGIENIPTHYARLTFAIARHTAVDLTQVFGTPPQDPAIDRLPRQDLHELRSLLRDAGLVLKEGEEADKRLEELRGMYEPYANALADLLLAPLPPWLPQPEERDNWQVTPQSGA